METIMKDNIRERLKKVIANELRIEPESIADSAHLGNDLGIDSADMISMLYEIEEEFKVEISDEEVGELLSIEEMHNLLCEKIK